MRVALADVGRRGRLALAFSLQNGRTILRHSYCEVPFKVTRLLSSSEPSAHLMLMHCTAGIFGGDDLECSIRVERGAHVRITQQSATKVHPSEGRLAKQHIHIIIESGAQLDFFLEPVIPFAESCLKQTTRIDAQPGSRLMFWEAFMAGRVGRSERWRFNEFSSETRLYSDSTLLYLDRFQLPKGLEGSPWAMSNCDYMGTGLYLGSEARDFAATLHEKMPDAGVDNPTADIALVRAASVTGTEFHRRREVFAAMSSGGCDSYGRWRQ